jgi:NADP-dependent 3-hydroxy acid dehydrogenase YdfG
LSPGVPPASVADAEGLDFATAEGAGSFLAQVRDARILVNDVGTAVLRNFGNATEETWLSLCQLNVISGVRMSRRNLARVVGRGWAACFSSTASPQ